MEAQSSTPTKGHHSTRTFPKRHASPLGPDYNDRTEALPLSNMRNTLRPIVRPEKLKNSYMNGALPDRASSAASTYVNATQQKCQVRQTRHRAPDFDSQPQPNLETPRNAQHCSRQGTLACTASASVIAGVPPLLDTAAFPTVDPIGTPSLPTDRPCHTRWRPIPG